MRLFPAFMFLKTYDDSLTVQLSGEIGRFVVIALDQNVYSFFLYKENDPIKSSQLLSAKADRLCSGGQAAA